MKYFIPVETRPATTAVLIKNIEIKNQTAIEIKENTKEGSMVLELTFSSNDYSLNKYQLFLNEFIRFLKESGYSDGRDENHSPN